LEHELILEDGIVLSMTTFLIDNDSFDIFPKKLMKLKAHEQRKYLNAVLAFLVKKYLAISMDTKEDIPLPASPAVSAAASLLRILLKRNETLQDHLVSSLTQSSTAALDDSLSARRSVIAALAQDEGMPPLLEAK
jgi:telomere length regulation protein